MSWIFNAEKYEKQTKMTHVLDKPSQHLYICGGLVWMQSVH